MDKQKVIQRWNQFPHHTASTFKHLRANKRFADIVVATDGNDGDYFEEKAHRNIICDACDFFRDAIDDLEQTGDSFSTVIAVPNVSGNVLMMILDYIYNGEVSGTPENMNSFMFVARGLGVKGLDEEMEDGDITPDKLMDKKKDVKMPMKKMARKDSGGPRKRGRQSDGMNPVKTEPGAEQKILSVKQETDEGKLDLVEPKAEIGGSSGFSSLAVLMETKLLGLNGNQYVCIICETKLSSWGAAKRHMKNTHLESTETFKCPICPKTFPRKRAFCDHVRVKHSLSLKRSEMDKCIVEDRDE